MNDWRVKAFEVKHLWLAAAPLLVAAAPIEDPARFRADLARFEQRDSAADTQSLRQANRMRLGGTLPEWTASAEALAALESTPARALALAETQLAIDPLNLNALYVAEQALTSLGRDPEAARRHAEIVALLKSITGGRDGASRETAWTVVSPAEKDTALALLGMKVTGETTLRDGPHRWSVVQATQTEANQPLTLWIALDDPATPAS